MTPEEVGLKRVEPPELTGGDAAHNARALLAVLKGEKNAYREIALLNAGGTLVVAGRASTLKEGVEMAANAVDQGNAHTALERLIAVSNG